MQHEHHRVPVTALAFFRTDIILGGEGNYLKAYLKDSRLQSCIRIFEDQAIHGIVVDENNESVILVYLGRLFRTVFIKNEEHGGIEFTLGPVQDVGDWILGACFTPLIEESDHRDVSILTAHNALYLIRIDVNHAAGLDSPRLTSVKCLVSRSNCILYSAHIHWLSTSQCLVASGTAFGDITVWSAFTPSEDGVRTSPTQTHYTFSAHEGSIFGVRISPLVKLPGSQKESRVLASCSDDRNIKLWDITDLTKESPTLQEMQRITGFGAAEEKFDVAPPCLAKAMGHVSRIWQVRFQIDPDSELTRIKSFGEDASVITWQLVPVHKQLPFTLEKSDVATAHSGKNIWAVANDSKGRVMTGGADGAIALHSDRSSFTHCIPAERLDTRINGSTTTENFRAYAFISTNTLVATTDHGGVFEIEFDEKLGSQTINALSHPINALRGFSLVATAAGIAFIVDVKGDIYGYVKGSNRVNTIAVGEGKPAGLFACQHNDHTTALLVTTVGYSNARFMLLDANDNTNDLHTMYETNLSLPANFIVTSFVSHTLNSRECVIFGSRTGSIAISDLNQTSEVGIVPSTRLYDFVHGKEAITNLRTLVEDASASRSWLFSTGRDGAFAVHQVYFPDEVLELKLVHQLSLPFGPNIEGMHFSDTGSLLVWGFKSKHFIAYDLVAQREVMSVECGGAHRNWAFQPKQGGGAFIWTKASKVYRTTQTALPYELLNPGGHGREIKSVAISSLIPQIIATGAEDTDIKLHRFEAGKFRCLQTLRRHNTGIQCLQWSNDGQCLFSSGGFEEFFVWKISHGIPYIDVGVFCESKQPRSGASDLRIMGFDVNEQFEPERPAFKIVMAYSDSTARLWDYSNDSWELLAVGDYLTACLTHAIFTASTTHELVTASTDGHLSTWQIDSKVKSLSWTKRYQIHQSAIHVTATRKLADTSTIVLTGGDDNAIGITRLNSGSYQYLAIKTLIIPRAHAAAVTGIVIVPLTDSTHWVVSTSIDQRVKLWQLDIDVDQPGIDGVDVKLLQSVFTAVADTSSLDVVTLEDGALGVLVSGVGMDVWRLPPTPTSENISSRFAQASDTRLEP